jgi:hypothetical protein
MTSKNKIVADNGGKPPAAGRGRPKGATNKLTRTIKQAIEKAFEDVGGSTYLATMAQQQPVAFMTLLGKVLPTQMEHSNPDGSLAPTRIVIEAATKPE